MGVYAELVDINPKQFKPGDKVTANVNIYNNEGAKYVTVEINDVNSNVTIWKWTEFSQLGETSVSKTLTVPQNVPKGDLCLQAFANGKTLPDKTFDIRRIWVNDDLVWENGRQIKTAWVELEHYADDRLSYNNFKFEVYAIPLFSSTARVEVFLDVIGAYYPEGKRGLIDAQVMEGTNTLEAKTWDIGDATDLVSVVKMIGDWEFFTKVLWQYAGGDNWIQTKVGRNEIARVTVPAEGKYGVLFKHVSDNWVGRNILVEVVVDGTTVGEFYTGDEAEDVMIYFSAKAGSVVSIYATPSRCTDSLCPYLVVRDIQLVKENEIYLTMNFTFVWHGGLVDYEKHVVSIKARGYYDNWFGGRA